ncbi:hypothetical protein LEUCIP111803_01920 [Leucobacter soli]|uniref:Enterochelin esterase n=1 Tax=Leucobacter soli TaxID=2812850 RepID=A0A916K0P9_9MICO|nr:hypothetical protein LEUCIP111803_01920 [Leucobacter soli]
MGTREASILQAHRELAPKLADTGARVELVEFAGGHDYACWRGGLLAGIGAMSVTA